jgi:hypothetical protein
LSVFNRFQLLKIKASRKENVMRKYLSLVVAVALLLGIAPMISARSGPPIPDAIWVDDVLYGVILTPNSLPPHGPKDGLYNFTNLNGQRSVGESKPGDQDYNGGRWQVTLLAYTEDGLAIFDADDDGVADYELTNWEQVQDHIGLGHLEVIGDGPSFTCPLKPQH